MKIAPVSELPCLANTFRRFILRNLCNNGRQRTEAAILILLMWEQDKFYPNIYWFPSEDNKARVEKRLKRVTHQEVFIRDVMGGDQKENGGYFHVLCLWSRKGSEKQE